MIELLLIYNDESHELLKLENIISVRYLKDFTIIEETKSKRYTIQNLKEIIFLWYNTDKRWYLTKNRKSI